MKLFSTRHSVGNSQNTLSSRFFQSELGPRLRLVPHRSSDMGPEKKANSRTYMYRDRLLHVPNRLQLASMSRLATCAMWPCNARPLSNHSARPRSTNTRQEIQPSIRHYSCCRYAIRLGQNHPGTSPESWLNGVGFQRRTQLRPTEFAAFVARASPHFHPLHPVSQSGDDSLMIEFLD